jgi:hypothetical protein
VSLMNGQRNLDLVEYDFALMLMISFFWTTLIGCL